MIRITYDVQFGGRSYGDDIEKALYKAAEDGIKKQISDKLRRISGLDNESVTIKVDLKNGNIDIGRISSPEAKQKILEALR